jgi:predicted PP-loop superfamily ATPase
MYAVTERPASGPGALDGFEHVCGRCGMSIAYSLRRMCEREAAAHAAWHDRTGR